MAPKGIGHSWQSISRSPDPRLWGLVLSYEAYVEHADTPMRRLEVPFAGIPMILSLGPSILIDGQRRYSFVAGLGDSVTHTEYVGEQIGMQVNLTPLAARRILGLPMSELTRQVVPIEDLLGERGEEMLARLRGAPGWEQRFALLDSYLLARLAVAAPVAAEVEYAWARLRYSHGSVAIGALAQEVGWSRRHLAARFRAEAGLPPKAVARILRFERVTRALRANAGSGLADIAYACGYADQAHLNRDFRAFAGTTPTDYASRLLPGGAGVAGEGFPNVQDAAAHAA
ncbi:MAG: helix-turn-helix domain-containing protein [Solirubrobacteraceae bacterium]